MRKPEDVAPLVFLRGQIELAQLSETSDHEDVLPVQVKIPKLVNCSDQDFLPSSLCLYLLETKEPVSRTELNLKAGDFKVLIRASIRKKILRESS